MLVQGNTLTYQGPSAWEWQCAGAEPRHSGTDWQRLGRETAADAPVAYDPANDASPYDPNDDAAVKAYWRQASIKRGPGRPPVATKRPTLNMGLRVRSCQLPPQLSPHSNLPAGSNRRLARTLAIRQPCGFR